MFTNASWTNASDDDVLTMPGIQSLMSVSTGGTSTPLVLTSESPQDRRLQTLASVVLETVTLCILWVAGLVGNFLVCLVIYRSRRLQSTTNYFVVSLAGGDPVYTILVMPFLLA